MSAETAMRRAQRSARALAACAALGCASAPPETPAVASAPPPLAEELATFDWSQRLDEWLPAIDACLARTPAGPAVVMLAWPASPDLVGVRTRGAGTNRWDCLARADGAAVERFAAVAPRSRHPAEASPVFTPTPLEPPSGGCFDHQRAFSRDGRYLGWFSYDVC